MKHLYITFLLILPLGITVSFAQSQEHYCGKFNKISFSHLQFKSAEQFVLRDFYQLHGKVWETVETGIYYSKGDTLFFEATEQIISDDSVKSYSTPKRYMGYCKKNIFYFGEQPPYLKLKRCSPEKAQRMKERLQ